MLPHTQSRSVRGRFAGVFPGLGRRAIGSGLLLTAVVWTPLCFAEQLLMDDSKAEENPSSEASSATDTASKPTLPETSVVVDDWHGSGGSAGALVKVPVSNLFPNNIIIKPAIKNPVAGDAEALTRGKQYFNHYNCVGCHAPNGGGGMGPSLSNSKFVYGSEPQNIYLSILQGRPGGMPAWGGMLPDAVIWDLVTYISEISKEPKQPWGKTVSADGFTIEQVPAEFMNSTHPWKHTQPFGYGQAPFEKAKGSPPLETPKQ